MMKDSQTAFFSRDAELIRGLLTQLEAAVKAAEDESLRLDLAEQVEVFTKLLNKYES